LVWVLEHLPAKQILVRLENATSLPPLKYGGRERWVRHNLEEIRHVEELA
jgi:hypothetical protein